MKYLVLTTILISKVAFASELSSDFKILPDVTDKKTVQLYSRTYGYEYNADGRKIICSYMDMSNARKAEQSFQSLEGLTNPVEDNHSTTTCSGGYIAEFGGHGFFPVMSVGSTIYYIKSRFRSSHAAIELNFLRFQKGGKSLRLQIQQTGDTLYGMRSIERSQRVSNYDEQRRYILDDSSTEGLPWATWEGNFDFVGCEDTEGLKQRIEKLESIADLVAYEKEMTLPGYTDCKFTSKIMTTYDIGAWNDHKKIIIPTLRNITLTFNRAQAQMSYEALNGQKFFVDQITSAGENVDPRKLERVQDSAEKILEILKGAVQAIAADSQDSRIPKTVGYFLKQKAALNVATTNLTEAVKQKGIPFFDIFLISQKISEAYAMIDKGIGLASGNTVTLGQLTKVQ